MKDAIISLQALPIESLVESVKNHKSHLLTLRQQKTLGTLKGKEISQARKSIAQTLSVLTEKRIEEAVEKYKNAKHLPKDMRMKLTRSKRHELTRRQQRKQVRKVRARQNKFRKIYFGYQE